jgi:hypothetical protein
MLVILKAGLRNLSILGFRSDFRYHEYFEYTRLSYGLVGGCGKYSGVNVMM